MGLQKCGLNLNHSQRELQPHGTAEFPCAGYESRHTASPEDIIPWHWHEELEIAYVAEGIMELRIPGQSYVLRQGDIAVLNGNLLHYAQGDPECALRSLVFSPFLLTGGMGTAFYTKYIHPLMRCPAFTCHIFPEDKRFISCFTEAFDALKWDSFGYEFTVREQLSHIMLDVYRQYEPGIALPGKTHTADSLRAEQMLDFMQRHFREPLTLERISAAGHVGERECLRCFKKTIGESPIQYLMKYRLMQSAHMLHTEQTMSVTEIAQACGFETAGYYSRQFKRFYQCTPREYRNRKEAPI